MGEIIGHFLAAGQRAEVFEWGSRVVKLYRSTAAKRVIFGEAAIHAAVEALGLSVPTVWSVQQIGDRWGIVFDHVSGVSFAERMRRRGRNAPVSSDPRAPAYTHSCPPREPVQQPEGLAGYEQSPKPRISTSRKSRSFSTASGTCLMAIAFAPAIFIP
jgi:hypothetical protein